MVRAVQQQAPASDGAPKSWIAAFAEEVQAFLGRRGPTTTREAARVLGRAAA